MKRTAIAIAVLLLTGCSDSGSASSSAPAVSPVPTTQQPGAVTPVSTPAQAPATTGGRYRVETSFFGVLDSVDEHGTPHIQIAETLDLGAEMFKWEFATAVAGAVSARSKTKRS